MTIVSVSLSEELLNDLNKLQKRLGFTGRSEIIRTSVRTMISEEKKEDLIEDIHALFLVTHDEKSNDEINEMRHIYDRLITTHLHNKIDRDKYLEYLF